MTSYICEQLSEPDNNSFQVCEVWGEDSTLLPPLTQQEANGLSLSIISCFVVVFIIRRITDLFKY